MTEPSQIGYDLERCTFMRNRLEAVVLIALVSGTLGKAQTEAPQSQAMLRMVQDIQKAIVTLPNYGVFDDLHFAIQGSTVILRGQASRPTLKSSAERVVQKVEGVSAVKNEIEVLPLSPNDDRLRAAVYVRLYSYPVLQKYTSNRGAGARLGSNVSRRMGITNDPPIGYHAIHIILKNGNVSLRGVVNNESDSAIAEMRANGTPGVFSVENDLYTATAP
ncbi:MAG: BON domain-containing protein [Bryobacteraceae bacterium]